MRCVTTVFVLMMHKITYSPKLFYSIKANKVIILLRDLKKT